MKGRRKKEWSLYLLRCGDGSLYTGIAKDVAERLKKHLAGKGAAYTRSHLLVELIYQAPRLTRSQALVREARVKRLTRPQKDALVAGLFSLAARPKKSIMKEKAKARKAPRGRIPGRSRL